MAGLAELLELMHGARHRFRTVRAEVVERRHVERGRLAMERWAATRPGTVMVSLAASPAIEPAPDWSDSAVRVCWAKPDRLRLEREDAVEVLVGDRWWSVSEALGPVTGDPSSEVRMGIENPPFPVLFDPAVLLPDLDLEVIGEERVLGRAALVVRGLPRDQREDWAEPRVVAGADEHLLAVDAERGVVLRLTGRFAGEPFSVLEVREIHFDQAFPEETWQLRPPPGREFGPLAMPSRRSRWRDLLRSSGSIRPDG